MNSQYRIFYSWQSDNNKAKNSIREALDAVVKQLESEGVALEIIDGGGGEGFIKIEDAVRMKIQRCDMFVGDITPVGKVDNKAKLLPNANVIFELGIATQSLTADRIIAVAMAGDWKPESLPFDINHYSMITFKSEKNVETLARKIRDRIKYTDRLSRRINNRFFSNRLLNRNIQSGKYLPDTFLENRKAKENARIFSAPYKMYGLLFEKLEKLSFAVYNKKRMRKGEKDVFKLDLNSCDIRNKTVDIDGLQEYAFEMLNYLSPSVIDMDRDGNHGWTTSIKVRRLAEKVELLNKKILVVTSEAGQGKTNFVCDLVQNLFQKEGIPYVFVNAYELSPEQPATGIAHEYNYIGNGSIEDTILKAERYCQQNLQYLIIVIDGLNENIHQRLFKNNLTRVLGALTGYHHVKVIMTCRKEFYERNYTSLKEAFPNEITEVSLVDRDRGDGKMHQNEADCIIERYAAHFGTKGEVRQSLKNELLENLLLMRIFFEANRGQDISNQDFVERIFLYERYYIMLCANIQKVIEQDSHISNVDHLSSDTFQHIIEWMINNNYFRNLPYADVLKSLPNNEAMCFETFLNANLVLRHDPTGTGNNGQDVINFTYEEIRDFLIVKYLLEQVYTVDSERFWSLIDRFSSSQNNLAEGICRFLFLYVRNKDMKEMLEVTKTKDWYEDTFNYYIWDVKDEYITDDDVALVRKLLISNSRDTVRMLSLYHWSPKKHPKLNLNVLFETLNMLETEQQIEILEKAWKYKNGRRNIWGGPDITERSTILTELQKGIRRRKDDIDGTERNILDQYSRYLVETTGGTVFVPPIGEEADEEAIILRGYDFYRYLMTVHKGSKEDFMAKAGVSYGFAKQMFSEIYDAIFVEADDVAEMYHTYYQMEYSSLSHFISMHYCIPKDEMKLYTDAIATGEYRVIDFSSIDYGSSSFENLFSSDDMFVRMYKWLNWKDDEN